MRFALPRVWLAQLCAVLVLWTAGCVEKQGSANGGGTGSGSGAGGGAGAAAGDGGGAAAAAAAAASGGPLTKAQGRLATMKLFVGPEVITAELATNQVQISTGMMFRTSMAEQDGMLFIFGRPHRTSFYMRNTKVPLSAAYIDPEGTILEIVDLHPLVEAPVEAQSENVQYVLEMNQGWFKRHNIAPGAVISTETGTLKKTFFGR